MLRIFLFIGMRKFVGDLTYIRKYQKKKIYLRVGGRLVYELVKFLNIPCDWSGVSILHWSLSVLLGVEVCVLNTTSVFADGFI